MHSPTWGKTFNDIATVEELYHWLHGPFIHTLFSPSTFDGDASWAFADGKVGGRTLGYGRIVGAVRLAQLRAKKRRCTNRAPAFLKEDSWCYGSDSGELRQEDDEDRSDFGMFSTFTENGEKLLDIGPFQFTGREWTTGKPLGIDVHKARAIGLPSQFTTFRWNTYPVPGFAMISVFHARMFNPFQFPHLSC